MKKVLVAVALGLSAVLSGCIVTVDTPTPTAYYDRCDSKTQCGTYGQCITASEKWPAGTYSGSFCTTTGCTSDASCAYSHNGQLGYCSAASVAGAPLNTCFERCYQNSDCASGFVCADGKDIPELKPGVFVCVPGTANMVALASAYDTCASTASCDPSLTRCETVDPKWLNNYTSKSVNICTVACATDAACPVSSNGLQGYCAAAGIVTSMQVCVERCDLSHGCQTGFYCATDKDISGLPSTVSGICVPL